MAKRKTNVQIVKQMMEFSAHGPLAQVFIMQAIAKYAEACAAAEASSMDSGFVSGAAWKAVAEDIKKQLDAHYAS